MGYAKIFHEVQPHAGGFITYSEGCNDDFNKVLWSCLGWNPEMRVEQVVREYSLYLVSARYEEPFSRGLLALEQNWAGPLLLNTGVEKTLGLFQDRERGATPQEKLNWRFQQGLYRAYYDAYIRARLIYETGLERHALAVLAAAREGKSLSALNQAEGILNQAGPGKPSPELRSRVHELAEALYQSIRMQSSVGKYQAISVGRGTTLDTLDKPLNRATELKKVFTKIRQLPSEEERLTAIAKLGGVDGTRSERAGAPALEFISVPSGSFEMGADLTRDHVVSERGIFIQDEFPVRQVTLTKTFDISKMSIEPTPVLLAVLMYEAAPQVAHAKLLTRCKSSASA